MRRLFAQKLYEAMEESPRVWLLTADLGYGMFDKIRDDFPKRFLNCGAAETAMINIAIGLHYTGIVPVVYSITPFLLARPFESLRTYVNHEKIPIKMVGSGRDKDYAHDGVSHWAHDDRDILHGLDNIEIWRPQSNEDLEELIPVFLYDHFPAYLNLRR